MKKIILGFATIAVCGLSACNSFGKKENNPFANEDLTNVVAKADLYSTENPSEGIGIAKFYQEADGQVKMELKMEIPDRADSIIAVHFHEKGDCGDKGNNAHGHWNPTNEKHGKWGYLEHHSGDIGNIGLDKLGKNTLVMTTDRWSLADTSATSIIGLSVIVHGGIDDYLTQPTGNSGPRIGCGVIEKIK